MNLAIDWEKILKNDTSFMANLKLYKYHFHEETNGIAIRNRKITKTFKEWLKTQNIGDILLKELELREERKE